MVIAGSEHIAGLRARQRTEPGVVVLSEADSLRALDVILDRPPRAVVLDALFAATARGAALVAHLKTDSRLSGIDVRLLATDESDLPLLLAQPATSLEEALLRASRPLDRAGTRQAVRFPMNLRTVIVNGEHSQLVDLSVKGAQVLTPMRVRPSQPLRLALVAGSAESRFQGTVAWSVVVPTGAAIHYRAGVQLIDPNRQLIEAFCVRHGGEPDFTFGAG